MSGETTTTTNTQNKPYKGSIKLIDRGLQDAFKLYKGGFGNQVDTSSHVIPWSDFGTQAYNNLGSLADQNSGAKGLQGNLQGIIDNGGFNNYQSGALGNMRRQLDSLGGNGLTGAQDNVMGRFQSQLNSLGRNGLTNAQDNVMGRFQTQLDRLGSNGLTNVQDDALSNLRHLANSDYSLNANPGAKGVLDASIRDATDAVNLNAASAGRYGSGVHEGVLAQKVGDLSSGFRYNDFTNWLNRRDAANQNMASLSQQGLGNIQGLGQNINALGQQGIGNVQNIGQGVNALGQQGIQNRQGLSSTLFNAGQSGLGNMMQAYQGMQAPEQTRLGIDSAYRQQYADLINDKSRIFQAEQNAPWDAINRLLGVAGLNGQYKDTTGTTVTPGPNPFLQTLGGVSTGVGLLDTLGLL